MHSPRFLGRERRTLLGAGAVLGLAASLRPQLLFAQAAAGTLRIGTIGAGRIGGTVGGLWVRAGHPVMFSSKDPQEGEALAARLGPLARAGSVAEAIAFGDVVFLAVPYGAMPEIGREYGEALKGKIVIDAGNAVAGRDGADRRRGRSRRHRPHVAEVPARHAPRARLQHHRLHDPRQRSRLEPTRGCRSRSPATTPRPSRSPPAWCAMRASSRCVAGGLADARRFQRGAPGYGPSANAAELRQKLRSAP